MMRITYDCPTCHRIIDTHIDFDDMPVPFTDTFKIPCGACKARQSADIIRAKYRAAMPGFFTRLTWALFGIPRISLDWLPDVAKASLLAMPKVACKPIDRRIVIDTKKSQAPVEPRVYGGVESVQHKTLHSLRDVITPNVNVPMGTATILADLYKCREQLVKASRIDYSNFLPYPPKTFTGLTPPREYSWPNLTKRVTKTPNESEGE